MQKLLKGDKEGVEGTQNVIKAPSYDPSTQRDHTPGDLVSAGQHMYTVHLGSPQAFHTASVS